MNAASPSNRAPVELLEQGLAASANTESLAELEAKLVRLREELAQTPARLLES